MATSKAASADVEAANDATRRRGAAAGFNLAEDSGPVEQ